MKKPIIIRRLNFDITKVKLGDQMIAKSSSCASHLITCQYIDERTIIFMFDDCVEMIDMNRIYSLCDAETGYIGNVFDYYIDKLMDKSQFNGYDVEYRIPTIEYLFSKKKIDSLIPNYKYDGIRFDKINKPKHRERRYKGSPTAYWLSTNTGIVGKQYLINADGKLGTITNPNMVIGVCPVVIIKK